MNVLFDDNGQSLKLGEIKLEKSQVCLVPAVKKNINNCLSEENAFSNLPWPGRLSVNHVLTRRNHSLN